MAAANTDNPTDRASIVYQAKLAEQAERYDEMAAVMKKVAKMGEELSVEERNLLSVAYKNSVGSRRGSWRVISTNETKLKHRNDTVHAQLTSQYRAKVEEELNSICRDILSLLDNYLIVNATTAESKVFYYKMKGDYWRYIAEFAAEDQREEAIKNAGAAYDQATAAASELPPTHPIRLGLALNHSVFYYEILNDPDRACQMAQNAFNDAVAQLDNVSEESYRDSTLIMQLLRENLTLWTSDPTTDASVAGAAGAAQQPGAAAPGAAALDPKSANEMHPAEAEAGKAVDQQA